MTCQKNLSSWKCLQKINIEFLKFSHVKQKWVCIEVKKLMVVFPLNGVQGSCLCLYFSQVIENVFTNYYMVPSTVGICVVVCVSLAYRKFKLQAFKDIQFCDLKSTNFLSFIFTASVEEYKQRLPAHKDDCSHTVFPGLFSWYKHTPIKNVWSETFLFSTSTGVIFQVLQQ